MSLPRMPPSKYISSVLRNPIIQRVFPYPSGWLTGVWDLFSWGRRSHPSLHIHQNITLDGSPALLKQFYDSFSSMKAVYYSLFINNGVFIIQSWGWEQNTFKRFRGPDIDRLEDLMHGPIMMIHNRCCCFFGVFFSIVYIYLIHNQVDTWGIFVIIVCVCLFKCKEHAIWDAIWIDFSFTSSWAWMCKCPCPEYLWFCLLRIQVDLQCWIRHLLGMSTTRPSPPGISHDSHVWGRVKVKDFCRKRMIGLVVRNQLILLGDNNLWSIMGHFKSDWWTVMKNTLLWLVLLMDC